jgi:hypothetical protein
VASSTTCATDLLENLQYAVCWKPRQFGAFPANIEVRQAQQLRATGAHDGIMINNKISKHFIISNETSKQSLSLRLPANDMRGNFDRVIEDELMSCFLYDNHFYIFVFGL